MTCYKDNRCRALKPREAICSMSGTLADIEYAIKELINRLDSFYEKKGDSFSNVSLALLIPFSCVTKIIGAGGCLIKELVVKTGAAIKVCSSKGEDYVREIVVTIDGENEQKLRGARAVLEKVELFRNGGPILSTGTAWRGDLLNQVRNSVPFEENNVSDGFRQATEEYDDYHRHHHSTRRRHRSRESHHHRRRRSSS